MDALLLLVPQARAGNHGGQGDFHMKADGRLVRRAQGKVAPFVFTGVSIAHPRLFAGAPDGSYSLNILWDRAIDEGRLFGVRLEGVWMHVGTPEALKDAERRIARADSG